MFAGSLFIVSAPSGVGKTTLVRRLVADDPGVELSTSFTTRSPRAGEQNGREYHFVDKNEFLAMRARGEFLEHAEVFGNLYGTSRLWLEQRMAAGVDIMLEIDWQGAAQVSKHFPDASRIFVLPPSLAELERRLRGRGTDSDEVIERRLSAALDEMRHVGDFDFVIINNNLDVAVDDLKAAVRAARLRCSRQRARHPEIFQPLEQE